MAVKKNTQWIDNAEFNRVLGSADSQWIRDMYDQLSRDGYDDEIVYSLIGDLLVDPGMLYRRSTDVNPFLSDDKALKIVLDDLAKYYVQRREDGESASADKYRIGAIRDKLDTKKVLPFLNVDALNNVRYTTPLNPNDEAKFRNWYSGYSESHNLDTNPDTPEHYYDYRGWWKQATPQERFDKVSSPISHLDDRYKMPGHPTFSDESVYHDASRPETTGGHWDDNGFFRPSEYQKRTEQGEIRYITNPEERRIRQRYTESNFKDDAYNPISHARGAFQISQAALTDYTRATGRQADLDNPRDNEDVRDWYFSRVPRFMGKDVYSEDEPEWNRLAKAYAAFNWGPGNLNKHLRKKQAEGVNVRDSLDWMEGMPTETTNYVDFNVLGKDVNKRLNTASFDAAYNKWRNNR